MRLLTMVGYMYTEVRVLNHWYVNNYTLVCMKKESYTAFLAKIKVLCTKSRLGYG